MMRTAEENRMNGTKLTVIASCAAALVLQASASLAGSCSHAALGKTFHCTFKLGIDGPEAGEVERCARYEAPGELSSKFDWIIFDVRADNPLGCACSPSGSPSDPHFDASPDRYHCAARAEESVVGLVGKVSQTPHGVVTHGSGLLGSTSVVYRCVEEPDCSIAGDE
jgi:hypothetical protein